MLDRTGLNHVALSGVSVVASALCRVRTPPGAPATSICTQCEADFFAAETARCERCAICVPDGQTGAPRICGRCLANVPHFDATTTLADYVSPVDGMVIALKFTARLDLAQFLGDCWQTDCRRRCHQPRTMPLLCRCRWRSSERASAGSINRTISHALSLSLLTAASSSIDCSVSATHPTTISGAEGAATQRSGCVCRRGKLERPTRFRRR